MDRARIFGVAKRVIVSGVLLAAAAFIIYGIYFTYLIITVRGEWEQKKTEALSSIAEYHRLIVQAAADKRSFNPDDPFSEVPPTRIYDRNNIVIGEYLPPNAEIVYLDEINPLLIQALTIMEDQRFYQHKGVNVMRVIYLAVKNALTFRISGGGSTITQQLAKNRLTRSERTFKRKVYELFATIEIEKNYAKEDILAMYVNTVYLGDGNYGFDAASRYYFQKPLRQCRLAEYAILVGMLPNPRAFSPVTYPARSRKKVAQILARMRSHKLIDTQSAAGELMFFDEHYGEKLASSVRGSLWKMNVNLAPYATEKVRQIIETYFPREEIISSGMKIYTTFDYHETAAAERALRNTLGTLVSGTNRYEGAVVSIVPQTGAVRVLIGGSGYFMDNELNRALSARRQIGSLVKPFIYAAAFDASLLPTSIMTDKAYSYPVDGGRKWTPRNYDGTFAGEITLSQALTRSVNTVAVQLTKQLGIGSVIDPIKRILPGTAVPNNLSLALGTLELTPLEAASAYSVFATYGRSPTPYFIEKLLDRGNAPIEIDALRRTDARDSGAYSPASIYLVNKTLTGVTREGGTGYYAAKSCGFTQTVSSKSGTTSDAKDAWFVVYTPALVSVAWIGSDSGQPLPQGTTGGGAAAPVLFSYLGQFVASTNEWHRPPGVEEVYLCRDSGLFTNGMCTNIAVFDMLRVEKKYCTNMHGTDIQSNGTAQTNAAAATND